MTKCWGEICAKSWKNHLPLVKICLSLPSLRSSRQGCPSEVLALPALAGTLLISAAPRWFSLGRHQGNQKWYENGLENGFENDYQGMRTHADACDACQPPWVKLMPCKKKALTPWCWQHPPAMANNFSDFICHGACLAQLSTLWGLGVMSAQTGNFSAWITAWIIHIHRLSIYASLCLYTLYKYWLYIYIYMYIRCTMVYAIVYNAHVSPYCMWMYAIACCDTVYNSYLALPGLQELQSGSSHKLIHNPAIDWGHGLSSHVSAGLLPLHQLLASSWLAPAKRCGSTLDIE